MNPDKSIALYKGHMYWVIKNILRICKTVDRIYRMYSDKQARANSVDPDETPQNLGLHCLPFIQQF